jgi:glucoamylase
MPLNQQPQKAPDLAEQPLWQRVGDKVRRLVTGTMQGGAFGSPGAEARWTRSTKVGVGTAYATNCQVWFTLADGIVNEVYYPHVDRPNTRDLQFLITDGGTFVHEEGRDLDHAVEYPEKDALLYRLTNSDRAGRYRIVKEVLCDPHHSVLLIHTRIEILDASLEGKLRVFALLAPHLNRGGAHNSAAICNNAGRALFRMWRADAANDPNSSDLHMAFGAQPDFLRRSCGYVGASDGWQDLRNFTMDWEFPAAEDGNIAVMGECDYSQGGEFTLALGFGRSPMGGATKVLQAFATPISKHRKGFVEDWQGVCAGRDYAEFTGDGGSLFRTSRGLLHAHEDKIFCGAIVASLSIPWGETRGDKDIGGYHLVWPRDLLQSCTGLLATGHTDAPGRALIWLACLQEQDGQFPQNAWIDGEAFWTGLQLDEVAAPVLLAWRVREAKALKEFDPWVLVSRCAGYLMAHGPVTMQERWEECSGYSPATLASSIAALVIVAEFASERGDQATADFALEYADWLEAHLEAWTATTCGQLVPGKPRHYIRIAPADANDPHARAEPDSATLTIVNKGGDHPARNVVSLEFLSLVRLGLRDAHDPLIVDSVAVVDAVLQHDLPQGPSWRRYNGDGYGQHADGSAFDGGGTGGCWPLLTGERGHYELAAGRDPGPFIEAMERFANSGAMLPEQVWCREDLPTLKRGEPTGSAMPLCWAHAEYMTLVRGKADGAPFDRIAPVYARYVQRRLAYTHEMWSCAHRISTMAAGKVLRVITPGAAILHWRVEGETAAAPAAVTFTEVASLACWYADLPTAGLAAGSEICFHLLCEGEAVEQPHRVTVA